MVRPSRHDRAGGSGRRHLVRGTGRRRKTGPSDKPAATIIGRAIDFPERATHRADWRRRDLRISGDADYAARFLDFVRVV
ncbi:hypothetical protein ACF1HJ_10840 [Streptomyces sp. NPDC013978]|uniref:hypothetical protein n=1 Tax=Streptomyces sp. NPDC013978 TaxID=3364869 RepID=UPI0036FAE999